MNSKGYIKDEVYFSGKYSKSTFQAIYMSILPYKYWFVLLIIIGFIGRAFILANTNIIGKWVDSLCYKDGKCPSSNNIFEKINNQEFIYILSIFTFIGFILTLIFRIFVARTGTHCAASIYDETTYRVSRFPISFFDRTPLGRIITRFSSDYAAIARMSGGPLSESLSVTFDLILFFLLIIIANPIFMPFAFLSVLLNYIVYKINKDKLRIERRNLSISRGPAISHFAETLQGAKVIRVYGKNLSFNSKFLELVNNFISQKEKTNLALNSFSLQMAIANIILLFIAGITGVWYIKNNYASLGDLGVAFTFIFLTSATVQAFFEWISALEEAFTGIERLNDYLCKDIELGNYLPSKAKFNTSHKKLTLTEELHIQNSCLLKNANAQVEVKNLCLRYQSNLPLALNNISFKIERGERVGIAGKTGSGKSSLIQAIYHLYPFENGKILIDGYEVDLDSESYQKNNKISLEEFRSLISLISQDPTLFIGTLKENLTNNLNISDEEVIHVAKTVGLSKLLAKYNKPLDFQIQEKGANLSAGEKQLICMARCLLKKSPIVLMDEATSSIDPFSEELLVHTSKIFLNGKTQIIVAHRLSTIEDCDRILWIDSGKLMMDDKPRIVLNEIRKFENTRYH